MLIRPPIDSIRLHVLRTSDGEGHPKALTPIINYPTTNTPLPVGMSICGSQVCLCLGERYPRDTIVWEWTTGELIFVGFRIRTTPTH